MIPSAEAPPAETLTFGLVRIGRTDLAVPAEWIEQIVPGPLEIAPLPQAPRHVLGAFAWRGGALPVVDLADLVRCAADHEAGRPVAFALVIRHPAGRVAVQVDAVLGVVRAEAGTVSELSAEPGAVPALFGRIYTPPGGGRVAAVLDLETLLGLDGVRSARRPETAAAAATDSVRGEARPHVVFRAGGVLLAVDAGVVSHVERRTAELDSPLTHPVVAGFQRIRGHYFPVIELAALLGLPETAEPCPHLLVVDADGKGAALGVGAVVSIDSYCPGDFEPLPPEGIARPECFAGSVARASGEVVLVLDRERIVACADLVDRQNLATDSARTGVAEAAVGVSRHYLVFRAGGGALAVPLAQLEAVMEVPADFVDLRRSGSVWLGLCTRLGTPVKLVDLGALLGKPVGHTGPGAPLLVIRSPWGLQGYVVDAVDFLQAAVAQPLPGAHRRAAGPVPAFAEMIRARNGAFDRAACVLELRHLAAQLQPPAAAAQAA